MSIIIIQSLKKFLVLKGKAKFKFKNVLNNEKFSLIVSDSIPEVVETIPGWAHNIKNIGNETMIVMLWANEVFNSSIPDTQLNLKCDFYEKF